jgi:tRNA (guanine-N7-)-methyltransferase
MSAADDDRHDLRSFGRRRGRKPSARQAALLANLYPQRALPLADPPPVPLAELFAPPVTEVWLEIGFGGGEHLVWQATHNPRVGLIGCEPFQDGVVKVLSAIESAGIRNIHLHADDARPVLRWLPAAALGRAFILFPDPWPKKRHHKRRLITVGTLGELARAMRLGAELRIATDIGEFATAILRTIRQQGSFRWIAGGPSDWRERTADWPPTRYEQKAIDAGRTCYYFRFQRT